MTFIHASEMVDLGRRLWGDPSTEHTTRTDVRFGAHGSKSINRSAGTWYNHEAQEGGGYADLYEKVHGSRPQDSDIVATYDYHDADGRLVYQVVRKVPKTFRQRRPDGNGGWIWNMDGVQRVPYRLPELLAAASHVPVFVCEGEKDADALRERLLTATTNPGGAGKWQSRYGEYFRGRHVVVLPDNDEAGETHALDVQEKLRGFARSVHILRLPNLPEKGDVCDWLAVGGTAEDLERLASQPRADPEPIEASNTERGRAFGRLTVLSVADIDTAGRRDYLLKGIISPAEISLWVGPPKCGKSFLMLHIGYLLSRGRTVFGRRVKRAVVLYVAAEGEAGIANRIRALRDRYGPSDKFHFIAQPADLLHEAGHKADLKRAAQAVGATLIVLDTLSRLLKGGDENSPVDMGTFVANVDEIRHETKAHIAIVHHGNQASNGSKPRGHSSLTGADDALIEVMRQEDGTRTARVIHAKDDADGYGFTFKLGVVGLGEDDDGDPITTLIVEEGACSASSAKARVLLTDNEKIALRTLDQAWKANAICATVGDDGAQRTVIRASDWRTWFYREGKPGESQETKQKAFVRARDGLLEKGRIATRDDFVWCPEWS